MSKWQNATGLKTLLVFVFFYCVRSSELFQKIIQVSERKHLSFFVNVKSEARRLLHSVEDLGGGPLEDF